MRFPARCSILLLILPLLYYGCKKSSTKSANTPNTITGVWELRQASGGMSPGVTNYAPGNGNILSFTADTYLMYQSGAVIKSGKFTVIPDTTAGYNVCLVLPQGMYPNRLVYDSNYTATKIFFRIAGDSLTFISGCYAIDAGHSEVYARISVED